MSARPRPVHVIVVAYHAVDALAECLNALEGAVPVTVVDNSSSSSVREATEAASAGVAFAFRDARVNAVLAHTLPGPNPSTRVLEKLGFARAGEAQDAVAGTAWRWTLDRARVFAT